MSWLNSKLKEAMFIKHIPPITPGKSSKPITKEGAS